MELSDLWQIRNTPGTHMTHSEGNTIRKCGPGQQPVMATPPSPEYSTVFVLLSVGGFCHLLFGPP